MLESLWMAIDVFVLVSWHRSPPRDQRDESERVREQESERAREKEGLCMSLCVCVCVGLQGGVKAGPSRVVVLTIDVPRWLRR